MASAHAVHTIHGTFAGISPYARLPAPSYSTYAGIVMDMQDRQIPALPKAAWRIVSIPPPSCRRLSLDPRRPLPQRTTTAPPQPVHFPQEDRFGDSHSLSAPNGQLVPHQRTRLASQSAYTVRMPRSSPLEALVRQRTAQRLAQDREARCKAVAGILLNRVHAVGKPMRRPPPNLDVPRTYKRSRLSTMVTVDDL